MSLLSLGNDGCWINFISGRDCFPVFHFLRILFTVNGVHLDAQGTNLEPRIVDVEGRFWTLSPTCYYKK